MSLTYQRIIFLFDPGALKRLSYKCYKINHVHTPHSFIAIRWSFATLVAIPFENEMRLNLSWWTVESMCSLYADQINTCWQDAHNLHIWKVVEKLAHAVSAWNWKCADAILPSHRFCNLNRVCVFGKDLYKNIEHQYWMLYKDTSSLMLSK